MERDRDIYFYTGTAGIAVAGISLTGLTTLWYFPMLPDLIVHQFQPYPEANQTIQFTEHQVVEIESRFDDSEEFGWCLQTQETDEEVLEVTNLEEGQEMNRSQDSVEFSCTDEDGRIHTHPGTLGVALPSNWDQFVIEHPDTGIECIAGNIGQLNCYGKGSKGIEEIEVIV
ncbi:hypothetical protein OB919_20795 [Halobacteria archaeon AArc-curdl1]|uniref:Uncharacterized protein n=1 Tax=Natronosalvus hydrolyticus TaxID=2979988 RepID=A0AAP2ZBU5_9EURY|nr:hypothetical protein [Halobacteria archaeon AArc-curdl1]